MLQELTIRNVALLEEVRVAFEPGFNVLTGETGAGKSIVIDAIGTVLGGRASTDVIRTGTERASVEAIFSLDGDDAETPLRLLLEELGLLDDVSDVDGTLILTREVNRVGRSVARINGRAVPVSTLAQVGAHLVDIHGQHEHLSLLRHGAQRELLDRFGGLMEARNAVADLVRGLRATRAELRSLQQDEREVARRIDLLSFQVEEIQQARLTPGEDERLAHERTRLANAVRLAELATAIYEVLSGGDGEQSSALDLLGSAARHLAQLTRIDAEMADHEQALIEATAHVEELGHTFRAYREAIEFAPERLEQVNERLDLIHTLQRKYGDTIEDVLAFGEPAAEELDALVNRGVRTEALERRVAELEHEISRAAGALSAQRAAAGERLARAVGAELRALGLGGRFEVALIQEPDAEGVPLDGRRLRFDESGVDTVEFRFGPNPGEPAKPVARTASGGELSRILLALKAVLSIADRTPTLIFDEVDTGIGGRNGQVVGEKLAQIAQQHQVLCVTHLPQVAAYGDSHFFIAKHVRDGRTATSVVPLDAAAAAHELAQMLGGTTASTLDQAHQLKQRACEWKQSRRVLGPTVAALGAQPAARNGRPEIAGLLPEEGVSPTTVLPRPRRKQARAVTQGDLSPRGVIT
ncbi:MAG: DNA repair protein RecN [Chloroflexi bacterium]|nr:DNA repair protein RecN [Chloroflexota bacterium]